MKISDEIRRRFDASPEAEYVTFERGDCYKMCELYKMRELADRIDAEMVELPRDRDGVPIHVGDTVFAKSGKGEEETVSSITLTGGTAAVTTSCRGI